MARRQPEPEPGTGAGATSTSTWATTWPRTSGARCSARRSGWPGRAFGRKMKQAFEDKVVPAMQAKAAQAQAQFEQQKAEQDAIAARYPELRGCMKDQVVFLDGGTKTVPVSEIKMPVTMAQAEAWWPGSASRPG